MARQPQNIHVYLYRENINNEIEFAIFQRADDPKCWQGVSGGLEDGESAEEAALRESFEEAGVPSNSRLYRLETISYLPSNIFTAHVIWGKDIVVCPMFFFARPFDGEIVLSNEHAEVKWLTYEEAEALIYWHDQKTALWELNQRILRNNLTRIL